ncbi:MAG: hypothetical protein QW568_02470 [Candidatus Anstonellaceae archaeon]
MGCIGRHLLLLFALSSIVSAASFSDCIYANPLVRFWEKPGYSSSNPYIFHFGFADFYSFSFDNSTLGMAAENLTLASAQEPTISSSSPKSAIDALSRASASLASASLAQRVAHSLSQSAQQSASTLLSPLEFSMLFYSSPTIQLASYANTFFKAYSISNYVGGYPIAYRQMLASSADAYDSSNAAAAELAKDADEKLSALEKAGAGSEIYSGAAKRSYFESQSFIASTACKKSREAGMQIYEYFDSAPQLPNFTSVGFLDYLQRTAGKKSSLAISLANFSSSLSAAAASMQSEYSTSLLSAKTSIANLQSSAEQLSSERLELMGELPPIGPSETQPVLQVGTEFGGIYSGLLSAKQALSESQQLFSDAQLSYSSKNADSYLANAISQLQLARKKSEAASSSLEKVRASATGAVEIEREFAESAIAKAESKLASAPATSTDLQAFAAASGFLEQARQSLASASSKRTLGEKFSAYSNAARLAAEASVRAESRLFLQESNMAKQALDSLSSLISAAEKDGLDLAYEKGRLSEYRSLLQSSQSAEAFQILSQAAAQEKQDILLRLSEKYSGLEEKYAAALQAISEIRATKPAFLLEFNKLAPYFPEGKPNLALLAGKLSKADLQLDSYLASSQQALPQHLSAILTRNTVVMETIGPPVLGRQADYEATITTSNPSPFSYPSSLSFQAVTSVPLYSSDLRSGDSLTDAYPEKGKTTIIIPTVGSNQALSFKFEKKYSPAQVTSSEDSCSLAAQDGAEATREISFFASSPIPSFEINEEVPAQTSSGSASYKGAKVPLSLSSDGASETLTGKLQNIPQGKNSLSISYSVPQPFSLSQGERSYQDLAFGAKKIAYEVSLSNIALDCDSAQVLLPEQFSGISSVAVISLGSEKVSKQQVLPEGTASRISFIISPLRKGSQPRFLASFTVTNSSEAISQALSQAELQVSFYNRSSDAATLSQAKFLISQNRTDEALSLLAKMRAQAASLQYSQEGQTAYEKENLSSSELISSSLQAQESLASMGLLSDAALLAKPTAALQSSLVSAAGEKEFGDYSKAASSLRKAAAEFRSSLLQLAWKASEDASEEYAKTRKAGLEQSAAGKPYAGDSSLQQALSHISEAQRLFTKGEHLQSFVSSSRARAILQSLSSSSEQSDADAKSSAASIASEFSSLKSKTEALLSTYSSLYSSLSGQSKRQLPFTPAQAQQKIDDAQKGLNAALKSKSGSQSLAGANASYAKLEAISASVENAISSLQSSAESSLKVAKLALSEARKKSNPDEASDLSQIESEVSKAESFLANSLYSDSIMSSDRAVRAANALLSRQASGNIDSKSILLAAVSLLFIAAAVYYFAVASKKGAKEKKKLEKIG